MHLNTNRRAHPHTSKLNKVKNQITIECAWMELCVQSVRH